MKASFKESWESVLAALGRGGVEREERTMQWWTLNTKLKRFSAGSIRMYGTELLGNSTGTRVQQ